MTDPKIPTIPDQGPFFIAFPADQQYRNDESAQVRSVIRTRFVDNFSPALRLPGMNYGIFATEEVLSDQWVRSLPAQFRPQILGALQGGDVADIGSSLEMKSAMATWQRVAHLMKVLNVVVGNHDCTYSGTLNDKTNFVLIERALKLEGEQGLENVQAGEVGGLEHVMTKDKFIALVFQALGMSEIPKPVPLKSQTQLWLGPNTSEQDLVDKYWRQNADGSWYLYLDYDKNYVCEEKAEERLIYAFANPLGVFETINGKTPVFMLGLDTMDFLDSSTTAGALTGHVSSIQVNLMLALMKTLRTQHGPNTRFLLMGHHPPTLVAESNRLNPLLMDEAIIAVLGFHAHQSGYAELRDRKYAEKFELQGRKTPLPEITGPSIIDNNQMLGLKFGVRQGRLYFNFDVVDLDLKNIPGTTGHVLEEVTAMKPDLLSYDDILARTYQLNKRVAQNGMPGVDLLQKIRNLTHIEGDIPETGRLADKYIRYDAIPAMVNDIQGYLRLFVTMAHLSMEELGLQPQLDRNYRSVHADPDQFSPEQKERFGAELSFIDVYKARFQEYISQLYYYFCHCSDPGFNATEEFIRIDRIEDDMRVMTNLILALIEDKMGGIKDEKKLAMARATYTIVDNLARYMVDYSRWLMLEYRQLEDKELLRPNSEASKMTNLFESDHFKRMAWAGRAFPLGSQAHAFLVHIHHHSLKQRAWFRSHYDPHKSWMEQGATTRHEFDRLYLELDYFNKPRGKVWFQDKETSAPPPVLDTTWTGILDKDMANPEGKVFIHPTLDLGWRGDFGNSFRGGLELGSGAMFRVLDDFTKAPITLALHPYGRVFLNNEHSGIAPPDLFAGAEFLLGDPFSLLLAGPYVEGGVIFPQIDDCIDPTGSVSVGAMFRLIHNGFMTFRFGKRWDFLPDQTRTSWEGTLGLELGFWLGNFFNFTDDFDPARL